VAKVLPDIVFLLSNSISRAALGATVKPGLDLGWINTIEKYVSHEGKFSKFAVAYVPISPPPVFWDYKCLKCYFWQGPKYCKVVEGIIVPRGWCAIYMPKVNYKPLSWPLELVTAHW